MPPQFEKLENRVLFDGDLGFYTGASYAPFGVKVEQGGSYVASPFSEGSLTFDTQIRNFGDANFASDVVYKITPGDLERDISVSLFPGSQSLRQWTVPLSEGNYTFTGQIVSADTNLSNNSISYSFSVTPEPLTFTLIALGAPLLLKRRR